MTGADFHFSGFLKPKNLNFEWNGNYGILLLKNLTLYTRVYITLLLFRHSEF